MTDTALLEKKLAFIETCLRELRELAVIERLGSGGRTCQQARAQEPAGAETSRISTTNSISWPARG